MCDEIIENKDNGRHIDQIEREMLDHMKPNIWNVYQEGNLERVLEVDFQKFAIAVKQKVNITIEKITTFTFYATVELLREQSKPELTTD